MFTKWKMFRDYEAKTIFNNYNEYKAYIDRYNTKRKTVRECDIIESEAVAEETEKALIGGYYYE